MAAIGPVARAGCATGDGQPGQVPSHATAQQLPPVFIGPDTTDGKSYDVPLDSAIVIVVGEGQEADWRGGVATPGLVTFQERGTRGSATFNPGFAPLGVGTT